MTRAVHRAAAVAAALAMPAGLLAQSATIAGRVAVKGAQMALTYTVVSASPGGDEQFTNGEGRFLIHNVPPGRVTLRVRHIGYAALDTTVDVAAGDTVRVVLEMSLITIELPAVHSLAKACAHPGGSDAQIGANLSLLFEQIKENAERNRLLSRSYPFELSIERKITKPEPLLEARFVAFDTITRSSDRDWRYAPGRMLGTREYDGGVFGGKWWTITLPELADFADERFLVNHCFDYAGLDVIDGDTLLRIDFRPAPAVRTPDVAGAVFLDPSTYQLRTTELALVNLTKQLRAQVSGQSIREDFTEIIPGVPVLDVVSSVVFPKEDPKAPAGEPATENQRTLAVRFLKGKP